MATGSSGCCRSVMFLWYHTCTHAITCEHANTHTDLQKRMCRHIQVKPLCKTPKLVKYCHLEMCAYANALLLRMQTMCARICKDAAWNFTIQRKPAVPMGLYYTLREYITGRERRQDCRRFDPSGQSEEKSWCWARLSCNVIGLISQSITFWGCLYQENWCKTPPQTSEVVTSWFSHWCRGEKPWGAVCPTWTPAPDPPVSWCERRQGPDPGLFHSLQLWHITQCARPLPHAPVFMCLLIAIHKSQPWFHGGVSRKEAQRLIEKQGLVDGWVEELQLVIWHQENHQITATDTQCDTEWTWKFAVWHNVF